MKPESATRVPLGIGFGQVNVTFPSIPRLTVAICPSLDASTAMALGRFERVREKVSSGAEAPVLQMPPPPRTKGSVMRFFVTDVLVPSPTTPIAQYTKLLIAMLARLL